MPSNYISSLLKLRKRSLFSGWILLIILLYGILQIANPSIIYPAAERCLFNAALSPGALATAWSSQDHDEYLVHIESRCRHLTVPHSLIQALSPSSLASKLTNLWTPSEASLKTVAQWAIVVILSIISVYVLIKWNWKKWTRRRKRRSYWKSNHVGSKESRKLAHLVHQMINEERMKRHLPSLKYDHHLAFIARGHSRDMAHHNYLGHENSQGESPMARAERKGYSCSGAGYYSGIGENCHQNWAKAFNNKTGRYSKKSQTRLAKEAVQDWMASPGHRQNIINPNYRYHGVGTAQSKDGKVYFTQNFYG